MNLFFKKKQIKGYPKSFAKRLTWRIMLRMIIIMGIPMLVVFTGGNRYLRVHPQR